MSIKKCNTHVKHFNEGEQQLPDNLHIISLTCYRSEDETVI